MKSYGDCSFGHGFEFELISCLVLEGLGICINYRMHISRDK
ncbi:hypothetical protein KC19_3G268300 [Ceratodon purpureus]|uniref:Uncharacterized protein n=1 Tax=Ceratodon purpureus TaxID=3225 RepID=A0A8T0IQC7_CERPU|nr:hypothetical protein KC19_3G268300 [Ceratodon purpureus]